MDNATEKSEVLAVCMDPTFSAYLHNDYLSVHPIKMESHDITLLRYWHYASDIHAYKDFFFVIYYQQ
jgi:hypothetical protein